MMWAFVVFAACSPAGAADFTSEAQTADLPPGATRYLPDPSASTVEPLADAGLAPAAPREVEPAPAPIRAPAPEPAAPLTCERLRQPVIVFGRPVIAYGTACQDEDGGWRVAETPSLSGEPARMQGPRGICREIQQPNVAVEDSGSAYGTACREADGAWQLVTGGAPRAQYCRTYSQTVIDDGRPLRAHGTACQGPDGSWRVVSAPTVEGAREPVDEDYRPLPRYSAAPEPPPMPVWTPAPAIAYAPAVTYPAVRSVAPAPPRFTERALSAPVQTFAPGRMVEAITAPFRAFRPRETRAARGWSRAPHHEGKRHHHV